MTPHELGAGGSSIRSLMDQPMKVRHGVVLWSIAILLIELLP